MAIGDGEGSTENDTTSEPVALTAGCDSVEDVIAVAIV